MTTFENEYDNSYKIKVKPKNTSKYYFIVYDMGKSVNKKLNQKEMINYAIKQLKSNKQLGLDKGVTQTDFKNYPINAWVYLKNGGLGIKTNKKVWK